MAAAATRSGADATTALVQQALDLAGQGDATGGVSVTGLTLALEIQAAVAEEVNDTDRAARSTLVNVLIPRLIEVLGLSESVLDAASSPGAAHGMSGLRAAALHAALAWLRLDQRGGGGMVLSPGQLAQSRGGLMRGAIAALAADDTAVVDAAAEFVIAALSPGAAETTEDASAVGAIVSALLGHRPAAMAGAEAEDLARAVCRVAVAVSERDVVILVRPDAHPDSLGLTDMVLALAEAHERPVMEAAADYFLMLNTMPVADRHHQLGEPLFKRLVAACLRRATLPLDFTIWDDAEEDRDTFMRFREQILADLLDNCYGMMRSRYLVEIGVALAGASTWQAAEAAVFAARAVSVPVKQHVLNTRASASDLAASGGAEAGRGGIDLAAADRQESNAFLGQLFARVGEAGSAATSGQGAAGGVFTSHPLVMESTARMVGAYAAWLGQAGAGSACVPGSVAYLLAALRVPEAFRHAAQGFRNVCARCAVHLQAPELLGRLMDSAEACMPAAPPPAMAGAACSGGAGAEGEDDRAAIVEGLARVIASLPSATAAAEAGKKLAAPLVARAAQHAAAAGGNPGDAAVTLLAAELRLVASAIRFLEFPALASPEGGGDGGGEHPAMAVLSAAWPTLSQFNAAPWRALPQVVEALCEVYTRALLCAKHAAAPLLPHLLEALRDIFAQHHHPACADCLATAVEVFSTGGAGGGALGVMAPATVSHVADPAVAEALSNMLLSISQSAHACLSAAPIADRAETARGTFELAQRFALFAPALLLASPALHPLMQIAVAALGTMERDAVRAAVALLSIIVAPGEKAAASTTWQQGRAAVEAFMSSSGEGLVRAALAAGADTCPRHLVRPVAQLLHALQGAYPQPVNTWIVAVVSSPQFPSVAEPAGETERRMFCELALRQPPLPAARWSAMVVDFFLICRKEATADSLIAHQM
jgi:hypothetical protein